MHARSIRPSSARPGWWRPVGGPAYRSTIPTMLALTACRPTRLASHEQIAADLLPEAAVHGRSRAERAADLGVELRVFEPLTPCIPCPCGYLESLRLPVCSTTFPQVDWLSPRGDA